LILLVDLMRKFLLDQETTALADRLSDNSSMLSGHLNLISGRAATHASNHDVVDVFFLVFKTFFELFLTFIKNFRSEHF